MNGKENVSISGNSTISGSSNGAHNLTVYAWDNAGNIGASKIINFTVVVPFPIVPVAVVSIVVVALVTSAALLVYHKGKTKH